MDVSLCLFRQVNILGAWRTWEFRSPWPGRPVEAGVFKEAVETSGKLPLPAQPPLLFHEADQAGIGGVA